MGEARCEHGGGRPCPWPRCPAGVDGLRLVVPGPEAVDYFERALGIEDVQGGVGRLVVRWALVKRETRFDRRVTRCGT